MYDYIVQYAAGKSYFYDRDDAIEYAKEIVAEDEYCVVMRKRHEESERQAKTIWWG